METGLSLEKQLTGHVPFVIGFASVVALITALSALWLFRRAVVRAMFSADGSSKLPADSSFPAREEAGNRSDAAVSIDPSTIRSGFPGPGISAMNRSRARHAWLYGIAGAIQMLLYSLAYLYATGIGFSPMRIVLFCAVYAWPLVLTLDRVLPPVGRRRVALFGSYLAFFVLLRLVAIWLSPALKVSDLAKIWILTNGIPTALLLFFLHPKVRAVGPLVLILSLIASIGSEIVTAVLVRNDFILRRIIHAAGLLDLDGSFVFFGAKVFGFLCFGVFGWLVFRMLARAYAAKRVREQGLELDSLLLVFMTFWTIDLVFEGLRWILLVPAAFAIYKATLFASFHVMVGTTRRGRTLLYLRVFTRGPKARLFDVIAARWRHAGPILMLAGPDLAASFVQPHEFLTFLSGKLKSLFIGNKAAFEARVRSLDLRPDSDWRFRINDFFCREEGWKDVLDGLVGMSDAILMDLRGFSSGNSGCLHEIRALATSKAADRAILAVDDSTDRGLLGRVPADARAGTGAGEADAGIRVLPLDAGSSESVRELVEALAESGTRTGVPVQTELLR